MRSEQNVTAVKRRIAAAHGDVVGDVLLKNAKVVNVFNGLVEDKDILLCGDCIAGLGQYDTAETIVDLAGAFVIPGLIDSHVHIESSFLIPEEFGRAVLSRGTTAVIADPHEIANVMGTEGLDFMVENSRRTALDIFFMVPSSVPSTSMETSGAVLNSNAIAEILRKHPRCLGLGEVMNAPGVIFGDDEVLNKLSVADGKLLDGHYPLGSGRDLMAYCAAGIASDHESVSREEAAEKLALGIMIQIREGTSAKNLETILPLVNDDNWPNFCFCADDIHAGDILDGGDVLGAVAKAVALGMDPVRAVQLATLNPARHYRLAYRGAVAPGYLADFVVVDNLETFPLRMVYKNGRMITGKETASPVRLGQITLPQTVPPFPQIQTGQTARVIKAFPTEIITEERLYTAEAFMEHRDLQKMMVMERHGVNGNVSYALAEGFGLQKGCIAQTVAHDSHNLIAIAADEKEFSFAAKVLEEIGGGIAVTCGGKVLAKLELPVAGLMTWESAAVVAEKEAALNRAARHLGVTLPRPFMTLSFLALPVIPKLKLTDMGLFDVEQFDFVPLFF